MPHSLYRNSREDARDESSPEAPVRVVVDESPAEADQVGLEAENDAEVDRTLARVMCGIEWLEQRRTEQLLLQRALSLRNLTSTPSSGESGAGGLSPGDGPGVVGGHSLTLDRIAESLPDLVMLPERAPFRTDCRTPAPTLAIDESPGASGAATDEDSASAPMPDASNSSSLAELFAGSNVPTLRKQTHSRSHSSSDEDSEPSSTDSAPFAVSLIASGAPPAPSSTPTGTDSKQSTEPNVDASNEIASPDSTDGALL